MIRRLLINGLLITASLFVAIVLAEIFLRLFLPQIFAIHPPGIYIIDPEIGYVLKPGFRGVIQRAEFKTPVGINRSGLRGEELQDDGYRILVLGDSQAFGFGVLDNETFSVNLQSMLAKHFPAMNIQVLNSGVPGYGTADQLAFLKHRGDEFKPDLVILQFFSGNDIEESRNPSKEWAAIDAEGMLTAKSAYSFAPRPASLQKSTQRWLKRNIHLANLLSNRLGYLAMRWGILDDAAAYWGEDFAEEDARLTTQYLIAIAEESQRRNAECLFLYTAGQVHVFAKEEIEPRTAHFFKAASQKTNVNWINSLDYLRNRTDKFDLYYRMDGHWTSTGHHAIAEILYENIVKLNLIPEVNEKIGEE